MVVKIYVNDELENEEDSVDSILDEFAIDIYEIKKAISSHEITLNELQNSIKSLNDKQEDYMSKQSDRNINSSIPKDIDTILQNALDQLSEIRDNSYSVELQLKSEQAKQAINNILKGNGAKNKQKKQKKQKKKKNKQQNELFQPNEFNMKLWANLTLMGDEIQYIDGRNSRCTVPLSIYELEIIREANQHTILRKDFNELDKLLPVSYHTISKAIYNIRENPEFEELFQNLHNQILNCKFQLSDSGYIKIGKTTTPIKKELANEWVVQSQNTSHLQKLIYNIQKSNPDIEKMQIKIICENYKNPKLCDLLKENKKQFVENNPSKRRNMLRNRG